ncbi:uncharacterized protein BXZ73DRAFT_101570 [Epithele typhae]|uniref:uncharacterized protein n=1 Tax=Epithele typhae TaxID=378194 RepID=UPI00200842A8|nr:uncharacterized protein BXZ73DRAFT_101570 [Epithele typhae]KAH9931660.1 hypothetical protein BXZ73DRAFT_101570 [Epithele typhae]
MPHLRSFKFSWTSFWSRDDEERNVPAAGFHNPNDYGGSMLAIAPNTGGLGEPLNVIVSGHSDEAVLVDQEIGRGFRSYMVAVGFASECLGQHSGNPQTANLGDGDGMQNETAVLRYHYGDPVLGTCKESIQGGNHFRYWAQEGAERNSGAYFLATSEEKSINFGHDIVFNGYNVGRDWLVGNATAQSSVIPTLNLTNGTTYAGSISYNNYTYYTEAIYLSGILQNSSNGVNHAFSVGTDSMSPVDGLVAVLTVKITATPSSSDT